MRAAIYSALAADATLMALLTGGLYDSVTVSEIGRQSTPAAFDANGDLLPCCLLRVRGPNPLLETHQHGAREVIETYLFQQDGAATIEQACERIYDLLHDQQFTPTGSTAANWRVEHTDDVREQEDQGLRARLIVSRYAALTRRR